MRNMFKFKKININVLLLTALLIIFSVCFCGTAKAASAAYEFKYTGDYQVFEVPRSGYYKLEVWGAQGGYRSNANNGGKGGYTKGSVYLNRGDVLYIYVGGSGKTHQGYNGGGKQPTFNIYGGGATDIRFKSGVWNDAEGLNSRLIVAGGGGTDGDSRKVGGAGGLTGGTAEGCGTGGVGASLSAAGSLRAGFGYGGSGTSGSGGHAGAGGGGWYGGGGSNPDGSADDDRGGGGGSNFAWNTQTVGNVPKTYSVSKNYYMTDVAYSTGVRSGDGYAKITALKVDGIRSIEINRGNVPIDFKYDLYSYNLTVDNDETNVRFNVEVEDGYVLTQSNRSTNMTGIQSVTNVLTLTDEETGLVQVYNIKVSKQNGYMEDRSVVSYGYSYTGSYEKFYVPATGIYTLEAWGAQGGHRGSNNGGKGGYSTAEMYLVKGEVLYIYVGGSGSTTSKDGVTKGWNGGGHTNGYYTTGGVWHETTNMYGGGASDIRFGGNSLNNRVLVAGGGGSVGCSNCAGGAAGVSATAGCGSGGTAGTMSAGGADGGTFGQGGNGTHGRGGYGGAGGGGWYGGGGSNTDTSIDDDKGGGGGSNFAFTSGNAKYVPSGYLVTDKNYLENAKLYNGNATFKNPNGTNETGHTGDGYVRITPKLINGVSDVIINDGTVAIDFDYSIYEYNIAVLDSTESIDVKFLLNDGYSKVESYTGPYDIKGVKTYTYSVDVINDITGLTVNYKIYFHKQSDYLMDGNSNAYGYTYTGLPQKFIAPASGIYTLEAWGAQGGSRTKNNGGKGGYSTGQIFLNKGQVLYVYVGSNGNAGGWNGGGKAGYGTLYGGGASDIRFGGQSLNSRLIVAGGGGSVGCDNCTGGYGGGATGGQGAGDFGEGSFGATQTAGGARLGTFGQGGSGIAANGGYGGGGGGGWYGGGGAGVDGSGDDDRAGGGGSGYVWTSENAANAPYDYLLSPSQYLMSAKTVGGNTSFPAPKGGNETGHTGNGFVKISFSLSYDFEILVSDNVTLDKEFDYETREYTGTLDSNDSSLITFDVTDSDSIASVDGEGTHEIHVGDNTFNVAITYVNGVVEVYSYHVHREANNIDYLNDIYFDGHSVSEFSDVEFNKDTLTYNVTLPYYMDEYDLTVNKGSADQIITNTGHVINKNNSYQTVISVTNETGTSTREYTLNISFPHSSKIKKLTFNSSGGSVIEFPVDKDKTEFDIEFESHIAAVETVVDMYDIEATATVTGDGYFLSDRFDITIVVDEPNVESTTYVIHAKRITVGGYEKDLKYNGNVQTVIIPYDHEYLLQAWGAQGGKGGGRGGYSYGKIYLEKGTILYVYSGGSGDSGGFNGGGSSKAGRGGGASDIRIGTDSLYSRVLVAGGGGGHGSDGCANGAVGGGITGGGSAGSGSCGIQAGGGTQTEGGTYGKYSSAIGSIGKFGIGANASNSGGSYYGGGGGGGWYGGGSGATSGWSNGGGGGSGFIYTASTASTIESQNEWLLNSDYYLTDAATLNGSSTFVGPNGKEETGHAGNGQVKITIPYTESENNYLDGIISNKGVMTPEWDYNTDTYYLNLEPDEVQINLEGVPADGKASVLGNGDYTIEAGTTRIPLVVTAENGYTKTYTVVVTREASSNSVPKNILINGLIDTYCSMLEGSCKYSFNSEIGTYDVIVPYTIREIVMVVDKAHYFQTVNGDGLYELSGGDNRFQIDVTSEDKSSTSSYKYNIFRDMNGNADLKSLKLVSPEYELNYSYNITDYYVSVPKETESVELEAIPDDDAAHVDINYPETLEYGQNVVTITVTAANGKTKEYYVYVNRLKSNNAYLSEFTLKDITDSRDAEIPLTPTFNKMNLKYDVTVENNVSKVSLSGVLEDSEHASVDGLGEFDLNVGANTFNVVVTAQDGSDLTYTFVINRKANSNTLLSSMQAAEEAFTESFDPNKFVYYMYVTGEVEKLTITATPQASTSKYQVIGNVNNLIAGKNEIIVRVTAEDGSTCDYKIIVNRTGYDDNHLQSLSVAYGNEVYGLTPNFDPLYDTYTLNLPNDITQVILTATANGKKRAKIGNSSVYVKNINLLTENPSNNSIVVTAEDGTTRVYNLVITREKSDDNTLAILEVENNTLVPVFDTNTTEYSFTTNDRSLNITATPNNKFAKVKISDNAKNLQPGENTITIDVTSEIGETKTYTIIVTRVLSDDNTLKTLEIAGITLDPEFDPEHLEYSFDTFKPSLNITAVPNNKYATLKINGSTALNEGNNTIEIVVTSESGIPRTYTITANRLLDDNKNLSSITASTGLNETFNKDTLEYTKTTEDTKITINATLESENATYNITDSEGNIISSFPTDLELGENIFFINVTAQNGDVNTYRLTITRVESSDSKLSNLTTSYGIKEQFDPEKYQYTIDTTEHKIKIIPTVRNKYATFTIMDMNGDPVNPNEDVDLITGQNIYMITVTAQNGETSMYNLVVNRTPKNIATIEKLGFDVIPAFDKEVVEYSTTVDETCLNLDNLVLTDPYATYEVVGNSDFVQGEVNTVMIIVTAEDGVTKKSYVINATRVISTDSRLGIFNLDEYEFEPKFDKDTKDYEVFIPNSKISSILELKTLKNTATIKSISVSGVEQSIEPSNYYKNSVTYGDITNAPQIKVVVEAEDLSLSTYTLNIVSEDLINNYLSTLNVSCGNLDPAFDRDTESYIVWVDETVTSCNVLATPEVSIATVTGSGDYEFPKEDKYLIVPITVTSARGKDRVYEVKIRRPLSSESRLSNLELVGYPFEEEFSSDNLIYNVEVSNSVTTLNKDNFTFTTLDPDSKVTFPEMNLVSGKTNIYEIISTAEDGTTKTKYTINVTRQRSSNATINDVTVKVGEQNLTCTIDPETKSCSITVPSNTTDFTLTASLPEGATVTPGNPSSHTLESNLDNKDISLEVTAEDGTKQTNIVHIIRGISTNNDLMDLKVNSVSLPNFTSSKTEYDKTVLGTMTQVMITAVLADPKAHIKTDLSQPFNLEYGVNTIEVVVVAQDNTEKTYTINITRSDSTNATLTSLSVKNYPFEEKYDPEETEYTIRVPRTKKTLTRNEILYTLSDKDAVISMDNKLDIDFSRPNNIYSITVTAGDGVVQKTYHISVLPELSTNNNVTSILLDRDTVTHQDKVFTYGIFDTDTTATLNSINLENEYATYNLVLPQTVTFGTPYTFAVTAENGDVATYTINLVKDKTRELNLANIETRFKDIDDCEGICTFDKAFNEEETTYEIYIPNELTRLEFLTVTPKNEIQTYEVIGNSDFQVGENIVIIRVKNSLGETKDYTLKVYREANSDPNLAGIKFTIPEYVIEDFDENIYEYNVEFNGIASGKFGIEATKKNPNQTVTLGGTKVLYFGRNDIIVHSESESCYTDVKTRAGCNSKDYIIHAYRNEHYSNLLESLTVSSGDTGDLLQVFNKYKFDYVFEVDSEVSQVKIQGTPSDTEHAHVEINGYVTETEDFDLKQGLNTFNVKVIPEVGDPAIYTLNIIRKQSGNVNLENLSVKDYTLDPEFSKNVVDYYINVDSTVTSLDISYTKESQSQSVYISGNSNFVTGENLVSVFVLSEDKTRGKTYKIHVTKEPSSNNKLTSIEVSSTKNDIKTIHELTKSEEDENKYTTTVPSDVHEVYVDAVKGQAMQRITGIGDYALDYGENIVNLVVTSESGTVNTYEVKIIREFDFTLDSLTVSHGETNFDLTPNYTDGVYEYTVNVENEIDSVEVNATASEILNDITGLGQYELNTGNNDIKLTVSYLDKGSVDYTIHVIRAKSSDNTLSSLKVAEGVISPIFDKDTLEYSVDIPYDSDSATVIYETTSDAASVEVLNNTGLEIGVTQDIRVIVTAENEETREYIIHATRLPQPTASNRLTAMYLDEAPLNPVYNIEFMNYNADVGKDVKRVNLHIKAEEAMYSKVEVYKLGTPDIYEVDMRVEDPTILLNVEAGKNPFIIRVTNYEGSIRNYQLDVYRAGPNEARIKSLSFDNAILSPSFDKNKYAYTSEVDSTVKSLTENIVMMDPNATYTITGNKNLKSGENFITITTLAQDGKTSLKYIIVVNKKASNNAYLSDIVTFPEKDFEFNKEKYNYVYHVGNNVNSVQIIGVREDTKAKITGNGIYQLTGNNLTIQLVVTAEDGTTKTYTVVVTKEKESNANLASLSINNGELVPEFNKDETNYTVEVENYVESITLNGIAESDKATVGGNQTYDLVVGENKLSIVVTAEDGTVKTYFVTVTRKENELENTLLEDLSVLEGELQPTFSPNVFDYVVNIPNEYESVNVKYVTHHQDAVVDIYDNNDLQVGHNKVTVKVSYDGQGTTYTLDVIRQDASNTYLNALSVYDYNEAMTPDFDKNVQNYSLELASDVSTINVKATAELDNSKVYIKNGDAEYAICNISSSINLDPGVNTIYIKVVSFTNAERVYKLVVNRANSDENKLLTLSSNVGTFDPKFDPDTNKYTLDVPVGTTSVTLSGTVSTNATVTGLDTYPVTIGSTTHFITVTSQSGIVNTYEVTVNRVASNDAAITNIKPSIGTLNPTYSQDVTDYTMQVEGDVNNISFDVTTSSPLAKVTGNSTTALYNGNNIITITSTAEDGITQTSVNIVVYKKTDIISINAKDEISAPIGTDTQLEITYNPEDTDYKEVTYSVVDSSVLSISETGLITPKKIGDTQVKVTSKRNPSVTKAITVHVINPLIETDKYIIDRDIGYVSGMEPYTTIEDFLSNFKNEPGTLKVYESTDTSVVTEDDIVKTHYIIKLVINNNVYDELKLVLKGDINGDGYVTVADINKAKNDIAAKIEFNEIELAAADINIDTYNTVADINKMKNYISAKIDSLNDDLYRVKGA